jgi:hypothetical protein
VEPSTATVATLVIAGGLVIAAATFVAVRGPAPPPSARSQRWAPLVPWLGSGLAVVLAVRGALAGAAFVALATLVHALVARWQAVRGRGAGPREG